MQRRALLLGALGFAQVALAATPRALREPALRAARPTQAALQAVARAGRRLVAAGERGLVIWSDDDGRSWAQAQVPVAASLTALRFADERRGWAVGNLGVVLRTDDGGQTWTRRLDGAAAAELAVQAARDAGPDAQADAQRLADEGPDKPLLDIALRADGSLLAVGAYGLAFESGDGGAQWRALMPRLPNPEGLSYYGHVERGGEELLYGEQGLLLRGAGETFAPQDSPAQGSSLFGALALREGPLLLMGLRGRLWRSAARGEPWVARQTHVDAALLAGTQLADGRVLLVGAAGQALLSRDGGQRLRPLALKQRFPFTGVAQAADGALLFVGMRGLLRLAPEDLKAVIESGPPHSRT